MPSAAGAGGDTLSAAAALSMPESAAGISGASAFLRERVLEDFRGALRFTTVSVMVRVSTASGAGVAAALPRRVVAGLRAVAAFFGAAAVFLAAAGLR
ncbi:hypothetical protein, partial [Pseudoroseomonas ludipueritiae]